MGILAQAHNVFARALAVVVRICSGSEPAAMATLTTTMPPAMLRVATRQDAQVVLTPSASESTAASTMTSSSKMPPLSSLAVILYVGMLIGINLVIVIPTADDYAQRLGAGQG